MVDAIGPRAVTSERQVAAVNGAMPVAKAMPVASETPPVATTALSGTARALAASPPVDRERVAQIKKAIANGTFPIVPARVADRLIALKLEWNPNDAS